MMFSGPWDMAYKLLDTSKYLKRFAQARKRANGQNGLILQRAIRLGLRNDSLGLKRLHPKTIIKKRHGGWTDKPVLRTGEIVRGTAVIKKSEETTFIGIPRGVTYNNGQSMVNIAEIQHEERPFIDLAYETVKEIMIENCNKAARAAVLDYTLTF